jgi:hypothetical protein
MADAGSVGKTVRQKDGRPRVTGPGQVLRGTSPSKDLLYTRILRPLPRRPDHGRKRLGAEGLAGCGWS